jgi:hypothetical protein
MDEVREFAGHARRPHHRGLFHPQGGRRWGNQTGTGEPNGDALSTSCVPVSPSPPLPLYTVQEPPIGTLIGLLRARLVLGSAERPFNRRHESR